MQNPRRPPADRRRVSGTRERPVSWSRRLEEARERRARVLAAREAQEGDDAAVREPDAAAAAPGGGPTGVDEAPPPEDEVSGKRAVAARSPFRWRIAGGFLAGAAAGAVVVWALLPGDPTSPPGAATGNPEAPVVASGPAQPSSGRPVEEQSATTGLEVEEVAADDGAEDAGEAADIATLPEITAADRARAVGRGAAAPEEREAAADLASDAAGTETSATSSRPAETTGAVPVTEIATQPDDELAPSQSDRPLPPPDATSDDEPPETTFAAADAAGEPGRSAETARAAAPPEADVVAADIAAAVAASEEDGGSGAPEPEPAAEGAPPEPAPAEDPPRPPEAADAATPDAGDAPVQGAPAAGGGPLYVHAAPGVSSGQLADVVARLSEAGYSVADTRRVDFRISQTNVRYFHDEDADIASGIAETISGISRDFTTYRPSPDVGTIEVWLEG